MITRYFSRKSIELINSHKNRLLRKSEFIYVHLGSTELICHDKNLNLLNQVISDTKQALLLLDIDFDDYVKLVIENDEIFYSAIFTSIISINNLTTKRASDEGIQSELIKEFIFSAIEIKDFREDKGFIKWIYISNKRNLQIRNRADEIFAKWLSTHKFGPEWQIKGNRESQLGNEGQQGQSLNYKF